MDRGRRSGARGMDPEQEGTDASPATRHCWRIPCGQDNVEASTLYTPTFQKDTIMQIRRTLVVAAAFTFGLGACGEAPLLAPDGPAHDAGPTFGTGHRADSTHVGNTAPSGTSTVSTVLDDGSAERAGPTIGTGR